MQKMTPQELTVYRQLRDMAEALKAAQIPASELWTAAGVHQSNWSRWSRGKQMPSAAGFVALQQAFAEIMGATAPYPKKKRRAS